MFTAPALEPAAFGVVAAQLIVVSASLLLADGGFASAIIREPADQRHGLLRLAVVSGFAQGAIGIVVLLILQPPLEPATFILVAALAPVTASTLALQASLAADLRFRNVGIAQAVAAAIACGAAIIATVFGYAIWAVPASFAVYQFVQFALHGRIYAVLRRELAHSTSDARRFAAAAYGSNGLNLLGANVDYMLVGLLLGTQALGIYALAYVLSTSVQSRVMSVVNRSAYPVMARLDPMRRARLYATIVATLAVVSAPFYAALYVFAPDVLGAVFGAQWLSATRVVRPLVFAGFVLTLGSSIGPSLLAGGRSDLLMAFGVVRILGVAAAVTVGARYGLDGVAVGVVVYALLAVPLSLFVAVAKSGIDAPTFVTSLGAAGPLCALVLALSGLAVLGFQDFGRWLAPLAVVIAVPIAVWLLRDANHVPAVGRPVPQ